MEGRKERHRVSERVMRLIRRDEDVMVGVGMGLLVVAGMEIAFGHVLRDGANQNMAREIIGTAIGTGVDLAMAGAIKAGIHHCLKLVQRDYQASAANANQKDVGEVDLFGCSNKNAA